MFFKQAEMATLVGLGPLPVCPPLHRISHGCRHFAVAVGSPAKEKMPRICVFVIACEKTGGGRRVLRRPWKLDGRLKN